MLLELGLFVKLIGMIGIFILTRSCPVGDENLQLYMKIRIFLLLLHLHLLYVQKRNKSTLWFMNFLHESCYCIYMLTLDLLQFTGWGRPLFSPNKHRPVSNETMFQNLISLIQNILITLFLVWLNNIFQLAQGRRRRKKKFKNMGIQSDHVSFSISENTMS